MPRRPYDTSLAEITDGENDARFPETEAVLVSDRTAVRGAERSADPAAARNVQAAPPQPRAIPVMRHLPSRPPQPSPQEPETVYSRLPLLRRVEIYPWPQRYNYYQKFTEDAQRYAHVRGKETAPVPFFSYIPQYSQLGRSQMLFYFWFREQSRARILTEGVDFPYVLLYIYEIINLSSVAPEEGAETMAWLWLTYRRRFPELDKYLSEWMCDYCLVHEIDPPRSLVPLLPEIMRRASLKEFYLTLAGEKSSEGEGISLSAESMMLLCSDTNFRAGKYYEKFPEEYETHIPAALDHALRRCALFPDPSAMRAAKTERDAYCGSLCAQTMKRRIRVEYCSFARSFELRQKITQAVKLAENQLRRRLKINARLKVEEVFPDIEAAVAEYFGEALPMRGDRKAQVPEERQYAHLYDAPSSGMDAAGAHALERDSWENTALLQAEGFTAGTDVTEKQTAPENEAVLPPAELVPSAEYPTREKEPETADEAAPGALSGDLADLLRALLAGTSLAEWCRAQNKRTDPALMAARLNDYAMDMLGDVILWEDGGWQLIDEYREDAAAWITPFPE